ncbi:MAG: glycosyltransferase [Cyanobacteria bacterium P01_H01_bin.15]
MKVIIIENNLRGYVGHFFNMTAGIKGSLERAEIENDVLINQRARPKLCSQLNAKAIFLDTSYPSLMESDQAAALQFYGKRFAESLKNLNPLPGPDDWMLIVTAFQVQIYGIAIYLETLAPERRPGVIAFVHSSNSQTTPEHQKTWRDATEKIVSTVGEKRFLFVCPTQQLADRFRVALNYETLLWPVPMNYGSPQILKSRKLNKCCQISAIGQPRPQKGFRLLPRIVLYTKIRRLKVRFSIQVPSASKLRYIKYIPGIDSFAGGRSFSEHLEVLCQTDILLLPYISKKYAETVSGLFLEGAAMGCVMVVPSNTWMAQQIVNNRAVGVNFSEPSPASIVRALTIAIDNLPQLSAAAMQCTEYWWQHQSADAFVKHLLSATE